MTDDALIAKAAEALHERFAPDCAGHWEDLDDFERRGSDYPDMARAVIAAVRDQIAAEALRQAADVIAWKRPEVCPCDHPDDCCGSAASCDAMRPTQNVVGESWLRTRADRLDPGEGDRG